MGSMVDAVFDHHHVVQFLRFEGHLGLIKFEINSKLNLKFSIKICRKTQYFFVYRDIMYTSYM